MKLANDTALIRHGIMAELPLLDVPMMVSCVLSSYVVYLEDTSDGITPENCATHLALAIPVRYAVIVRTHVWQGCCMGIYGHMFGCECPSVSV